jgi:predicted anti-sigma-YlaC factor YlaD
MTIVVSEKSCARARRALSLALDGEASPHEIYALATHLGRCEPCRRFTARVGALTRVLRSVHHSPVTHQQATPKGAGS